MINNILLWMLLLPLILSGLSVWVTPRITRGQMTIGKSVIFAGVGLLISTLILAVAFYAGKGSKTGDTEIWNGEVISKERVHGDYKRSYDCNCKSINSCSGSGKNRSCTTSQKCDTCYEDHYTVSWNCKSNIGGWRIDHADRTSRSVYSLPDPPRYSIIKPGDPVARANSYTNYIKAVPSSLFRPAQESLKVQFANQIPAYPINVYDFYKVDRVVPVGVSIPNAREWNDKLSDVLKKLGPAKQANAVVVITKSADPNYFYALQDAWQNGKKNDIVLVIGAPEFPKKAAWVNVMALTENNIFQVKLRDDILALEELTADAVIGVVQKNGAESFKRKRMRDFQYLEDEIDPPEWVMWTSMILILGAYLGFWFALRIQFAQVSPRLHSVYNRTYR